MLNEKRSILKKKSRKREEITRSERKPALEKREREVQMGIWVAFLSLLLSFASLSYFFYLFFFFSHFLHQSYSSHSFVISSPSSSPLYSLFAAFTSRSQPLSQLPNVVKVFEERKIRSHPSHVHTYRQSVSHSHTYSQGILYRKLRTLSLTSVCELFFRPEEKEKDEDDDLSFPLYTHCLFFRSSFLLLMLATSRVEQFFQ